MAKDRYIRMQHDCYDALAVIPMSDAERRVMMVVVRYTVGFHRYDTDLSNRFIAEFLGNDITEQHAGYCIKKLCEKGYIKIVSQGKGTHPRKIRFCYTTFRGRFREVLRKISPMLEEDLDEFRGIQLSSKEIKGEIKNKEKKNKERFASEPDSLFSFDETEIDEQEIDPESELSDEEWMLLHSQDEDDE